MRKIAVTPEPTYDKSPMPSRPSVPRKRHGWPTLMPSGQDDSLYRYECPMVCREIVDNPATQKPKIQNSKFKLETKMTTENRDAFVKKFHNAEFGIEVYAATRVQAGLARVFARAEMKAFNRIANRGSNDDIEDLIIAYRLIGGKIISESRKKLTFLLFGEVKNETKNGKVVHFIKHVPDKEMKAAKADKKDLMARVKLLSESFSYLARETDKIESLLKAYARLSEEDQSVFLRKLSDIVK